MASNARHRLRWAAVATIFAVAACAPSPAPSPSSTEVQVASPAATPHSPVISAAPSGATSDLTAIPCDFPPPGDLRVTCAQLTVPEDRGRPNGRRLHLVVATVHSLSSSPEPDPILWVNGGLGGRTIDYALGWLAAYHTFVARRDVIILDERGSGYSEPDLNCSEMDSAAIATLTEDVNAQASASVAAAAQCANRLAAVGVDLSAFTSAANVADLEDLRGALGIGAWNLYGISSGTREALDYLRDDPGSVRSVVLDSVAPPGVDDLASFAPDAARAIDLLFHRCAVDRVCARDHPGLPVTFEATIRALDRSPRRLAFSDVYTGDKRIAVAFGSTLVSAVFDDLYDTSLIPRLPALIEDAARGGTELLERELSLEAYDRNADAEYLEVFCADSFDYTTAARIRAATTGIRPSVARTFPVGPIAALAECRAFGAPHADPRLREPVTSAVPVLLFSGELDPITPPAWAELAAATLSHGQRILFPGVGHGVLGTSACSLEVADAFLAAPLDPVPRACLATLREPSFTP